MKKKKIKDPLAEAARLLNENAPEGESLAYINQDEAKLLKSIGGLGKPVNSSGVPSYIIQFWGWEGTTQVREVECGSICTGICYRNV
jgi:hypothetical protein